MYTKRLFWLYAFFLAVTAMLTVRLYRIADHRSEAENVLSGQYTRRLDAAERKGLIFDRDGTLLSEKKTGFRTVIDPRNKTAKEMEETARVLSASGGREESYYIEKLFSGVPFCADTTRRIDARYGTCIPVYGARDDGFLCHVLGYRDGDGKGVTGLMRAYDDYLTETAARFTVRYEADATGAVMEYGYFSLNEDGYNEPNGLALTVREPIQRAVETVCDATLDRGAVVVQDVQNGELAAVCSRPSYNPNTVAAYLSGEKGELTNRAFSAFTPGSVFKTVVAAAALEQNPSAAERTYCCDGAITIQDTTIRCHKRDGHGELTMEEAFAQSCNPYFIDLGLSLGKEKIYETARKMGLFCYDDVSLLPRGSENFPESESILPGALANLSVGQGDILLSPVGVCGMMATAVTGTHYKPSLVKSFTNAGRTTELAKAGTAVLSRETVDNLKKMLVACVEDGTGYRAAGTVPCGGKTATAQSGQIKDGNEVIHGWFAGFYPIDEPRYAVCVLCDGNGENQTHPSAVFRAVVEAIEKVEPIG